MKKNESNYKYWQNTEGKGFDTHGSYMIASENNEYAQMRTLLANYFKDGDSVLDVGCACGNNLEWWESLGRKFTYKGVDYAEDFTKANKKRRPKIKWGTMDARLLKDADDSFNVVMLYDVLDALEHWEMALDEATRVAKDTVVITMWMDAGMLDKENYLRAKGLNVVKVEMLGDGVHYHQILVGRKK